MFYKTTCSLSINYYFYGNFWPTCINPCHRKDKNNKKPRRQNIGIFPVPCPNNNVHTGQGQGAQQLYTSPNHYCRQGNRHSVCAFTVSDNTTRAGFFMFLLLLISAHEMRWLVLVANDVNLFTDIRHQHQPIILKKGISINCLSGNSERILGR